MSRIKYYDEASGGYKYADTAPGGSGAISADAVRYTEQDKTEAEVAIARDNIGLPFGRNKKVRIPLIENKTLAMTYDDYLGCYRSELFTASAEIFGDMQSRQNIYEVIINGTSYIAAQQRCNTAQTTAGGAIQVVSGFTIGNAEIPSVFSLANLFSENSNLPFCFIYGKLSSGVITSYSALLYTSNVSEITYSLYDITGEVTSFPPYLDFRNYGILSVGSGGKSIILNEGISATGVASFACGAGTKATGEEAHAEGLATEAIGQASHAEGANCKATQLCAHAEGRNCTAAGQYSHAEGNSTSTNGNSSHVEGQASITNGTISHAGGNYSNTGANARAAFAHGNFAQADYASQFCVGYGNNPQSDSVFEVGNGLNAKGQPNNTGNVEPVTRQNAFRVTQAGDCIAQNSFSIEKGDGTRVTINAAQLEALLALIS